MKKRLSIAAIALMMAGSSALACSGCGCEAKKADKDKKECGSCKSEEKKTACSGAHKSEKQTTEKSA